MKRLKHILLLYLSLFSFFACHKQEENKVVTNTQCTRDLMEIVAFDTLRVGTMYGATSYFYYQDDPVGYDYELAQQLADYLNLQLDVRIASTEAELRNMLELGEIDVICYDFSKSLSSEFHMIPTHGQGHMTLIQRKGKNMITRVTDLRNQPVAVVRNSIFHQQLNHLNEETGGDIRTILAADSILTDTLIAQVSDGRLDYTLGYYSDYEALKNDYPNLDANVAIGFDNPTGWLTRSASVHLNDALDSWWASQNPRKVQILRDKYWEPNAKEEVDPKTNKSQRNLEEETTDESVIEKATEKKQEKPKKAEKVATPGGRISPYDHLFQKYSPEIGWDWKLLAALCYCESKFNPNVRSHMGAMGLMQLVPKSAAKFGLSSGNYYDPEANIRAGVQLIKHLNMVYSNVPAQEERIKFILASYNAGAAHIKDAQKLAAKYGANPGVWDGNVELYMRKLSEPKYYNDPVCRYGYFKGGRVCGYVDRVLERYEVYK